MQLEKTQVSFLHVAAPAINAVGTFHASTLIAGAAFLGNEMHYIKIIFYIFLTLMLCFIILCIL